MARGAGIAQRYVEAMNAADIDAMMALFAPDAVLRHPSGVYAETDAIRGFFVEIAFGNAARLHPVGGAEQGDTAWLFLPGNTVAATHVPAASGAKYTDGEVTYWSHGDEASIEAPGFEAGECRNNRRAAIWEHAKLNGVDFRAVGNEPGWHLEIRRGRSIVFVTDYGQARYEFPAPELDEDRDRARAVYRTGDGDHELVVQLEGRRCLDTMADDEYETTVTVTLDGHEVRGCGRPLH